MKEKNNNWWRKLYVDIILFFFTFLIMFVIGIVGFFLGRKTNPINTEDNNILITETVPSFYALSPKEGLIEALEYYNVDYPDIVYAQAVLETGDFKSKVCYEYNNLFGLYNSRKGNYYKFNHWAESVIAYRDMIQGGNRGEEHYYDYLKKIGYAEDKEYINKVRKIADAERNKRINLARDTIPEGE